MKNKDIEKSVENINKEIMPTVNEIEQKMKKLQNKYNFSLNFSFPEITMEEVLNPQNLGDPPKADLSFDFKQS